MQNSTVVRLSSGRVRVVSLLAGFGLFVLLFLQYIPAQAATGDRIIVRFRGGADASSLEAQPLVSRFSLREHKRLTQLGAEVLTVPVGVDASVVVASLRANKGAVDYAEVDRLISIADVRGGLVQPTNTSVSGGQVTTALTPNDTYYASSWYHPLIGSPSAWDLSTGSGVVIAVLDTGVNCSVTDLVGKCVSGWNIVGNNATTDDDQGHGTWVATVAAAAGNNGAQVTGAAFGAKVMPIKINQPTTGSAYYSDIIRGVLWAADNGAKVVNISFAGTADPGFAFASAAGYLRQKGGILFQSSGNNSTTLTFPNYATINLVGATNSTDTVTSWSNKGAAVDIVAPGSGIYAVGRDNLTYIVSGTSFSSPMTAGVAALMFARNPSLLPWQLENILFAQALDLGTLGYDTSYGWGRANAGNAVANALSAIPPDITPPDATGFNTWSYDGVSTVNLGWLSVYDNTGPVTLYHIYRNGSFIGSSNTLSFIDAPAPAGANSYTVRAVDPSGRESANSGAVVITVVGAPTDTTPPSTPTNLTATASATQIALSWTASTDNVGVTGYNIYRGGVLLSTSATPSYTDVAVTAGSTYTYTAQAHDAAGNLSGQSNSVNVTVPLPPDTTPPSTPTNLTATASPTQIALSWTASTDNVGVTGYDIYRGGVLLTSVTSLSYTDTAVTAGSTYTYTVQAYDAAGNLSSTSNSVSATVPNPTLTINNISAVPNRSARTATISWNTGSTPATGHVMYGRSPSTMTTKVSATQLQISQQVTLQGLVRRATYYYQVTATANGTSVTSAILTFIE